jgi:hypothetical protein
MEFDELQKIWDSQSNRTMYGIDENALSKQITSKKNTAHRTINFSELVVIFTHIIGTGILLVIIWKNELNNVLMNLMTAGMFITAILATVIRIRRIYSKIRFDRTMFGELDHAISLATHQVRFSSIMRWNSLPIAALAILLVWHDGKSIWIVLGMTIFFLVAYFASQWEVKLYKRKKEELVQLKKKLEEN